MQHVLRQSNRCRSSGTTRCACSKTLSIASNSTLLDTYWRTRGIFDEGRRSELVNLALETLKPAAGGQQLGEQSEWEELDGLPGVPVTWSMRQDQGQCSTPEEVLEVSRRLLLLQDLLGTGSSEDAAMETSSATVDDLVFMVVREPTLLTTDAGILMRRLLEMRVLTAGHDVDVVRCVVRQPALLTSQRWELDLQALLAGNKGGSLESKSKSNSKQTALTDGSSHKAGDQQEQSNKMEQHDSSLWVGDYGYAELIPRGYSSSETQPPNTLDTLEGSTRTDEPESNLAQGASPSSEQVHQTGSTVHQILRAWEHGLSADGDDEWKDRFHQLSAYVSQHGDASVGFREDDDADLARWAAKQRSDAKQGLMPQYRRDALERLCFQFSDDDAEWLRWYHELKNFKSTHGHCSPWPLAQGVDLRLINWASIQRIARRSRMLSASRIEQLDVLGFDWTGADPLS